MPPADESPKKKPSGGRPRNHSSRVTSSDSRSPSSSDASITGVDTESKRHVPGPTKASTLRLVEQNKGEGDPFSDSTGYGAWTEKINMRSPESEQGGFSFQSPVTTPLSAGSNPSVQQRSRIRPLPQVSQDRSAPSSATIRSPDPVNDNASFRSSVMSQESESKNSRRPRPLPELSRDAKGRPAARNSGHDDDTSSLYSRMASPVPDESKPPPKKPYANSTRPASPAWTDKQVVRSPEPEADTFSLRSGMKSPTNEKAKASPKQRSYKPLVLSSRPSSPIILEKGAVNPPPSPSKARWEHIRQHVLPDSPHSQNFTAPPPPPVSRPSTPQQTIVAPPRSQTPKPSRLARLGFKHVVEQVRDVAVVDDTRRFGNEILKACWQSRFLEPMKGSKPDREPTLATGSSNLYLPFMSNEPKINNGTNTSTAALNTSKKHDLRRPQSVQSLALSTRPTPTIKYIHSMLLHYAAPSAGRPVLVSHLPHETQLMSALLSPFTTRTVGTRGDEERWFGIESFEIAVKTWKAPTNQLGIERCLWCCKAASMAPQHLRMRILADLSSLLNQNDKSVQINTPGMLITLVQGLFSLLASMAFLAAKSPEMKLIQELISNIQYGQCGEMTKESIEVEFKATLTDDDEEGDVRDALVIVGLGKFLEHGAESSRRWLLRYSTEQYWAQPAVSFTPLLTVIHTRKISTFSRGVLSLLLSKSRDPSTTKLDAEITMRILRTRMLPEVDAISGPNNSEPRGWLIRIILELLSIEDAKDIIKWVTATIHQWYREEPAWKSNFENRVQNLITESDWPVTLRILSALLKYMPEDVKKPLVASFLPSLNDQLVAEPPAHPCLPLTELLDTVSQTYPQIFYKPLFACAASSKELTVQNYLAILTVISRFLPDFWTRDAEMISVALMSDAAKKPTAEKATWGKARLGQSALIVELIGRLHATRQAETFTAHSDSSHGLSAKFFTKLETRLGILLEAKEKTVWVPLSQRALFSVLFLETRLLTRSLKSASWLPRIIMWLQQLDIQNPNQETSFVDVDALEELDNSTTNLEMLYNAVQNSFRESHKRRSTAYLSAGLDSNFHLGGGMERNAEIIEIFAQKTIFLSSLKDNLVSKILELLVALSGMLSQDEYKQLGPVLWGQCLESTEKHAIPPACFLIMQCAEKAPKDFLKIVESDLHNSEVDVRLRALRRISLLFNWRFQLLSQQIVMDRNHRRPFKLARGPLPFIATDIGSGHFVLEEDPTQSKHSLPLELRKRLSEIGWAQDDEVVDQKLEWAQTPMSLIPSQELDLLDDGFEIPMSPNSPLMSPAGSPMKAPPSPGGHDTDLLRRKLSTSKHSHGVKRRAAFVPPLSTIFPQMASLVYDTSFSVASNARDTILDLMRNDPALLTRPIFDLLADDQIDVAVAISTLRAFDHVRRVLPPAMTHHVFNHIAGFLKYVARQVDTPSALGAFANSVPTLSKLVTQVSDMSIREIRRAKVEIFLIPSGSLWFPPSAPTGPMFPRMLGPYDDPFDPVPSHLKFITMIRLSQNMLFLSMLKRNPQDVQLIRKNMSRLVLPSRDNKVDARPLKLADFVPHKLESERGDHLLDGNLRGLSLMLSRSYLLLIAQIFRSMSRHLNDRNELAVLIDGLNRILLIHGDDIGIVSQSMIALMAACTRFRRLFTSGGGYTLFMPMVVKVYVQSELHSGIRLAIEYAINRFYALHQEAFVFQSLDIIAHVIMVPDIEGDWVAKGVYNLFSTLRATIPPNTPDAAGIHNSNKVQEREALIVRTAEDKPQTFLASLRKGGKQGKETVLVDLPEEYETKRLGLDNFVKLFLTVIAHDPNILRAEHFLHFLRFLTPYLYHASNSARSVLRDGIDALGIVLTKAAAKAKVPDGMFPMGDFSFEVYSQEAVLEDQLLGKSKSPSDVAGMRLDFLSTIVAFTEAGGYLGSAASQRTMDLIKLMLRDSIHDHKGRIASFFSDYSRASLLRDPAPSLKEVLAFLSHLVPMVSAYATTVDFSGVYNTIAQLASNLSYANEPAFARIVVLHFCGSGLAACDLAASEKALFSLPSRLGIIRLTSQAIFLRGADVIAELEKHVASYDLLIGVVLPLVLTLKTTADVISDGHWADPWRRDVHARTWTRLLTYVMSACQRRDNPRDASYAPERTKSYTQDKRRSAPSSKAQMMTLVAAIQILKAIIIRAEEDLSACLPGIWSRISSFLRSILADGDASFALVSQDISAPPSPSHSPSQSPRASIASFNPQALYDQNMASSVSANLRRSSAHVPLAHPRVIDYSLWSLFELLCLCRSPLMIQMRLFLQEKVVILDQELHYHQDPHRPRSSRISSGVFSKPRRRMSGYLSGGPSLENSPVLGASSSFPSDPSLFHLDPTRQPGYQRFPVSPGGLQESTSGPRIVHLGPVNFSSVSGFRAPLSPGGGVRLLNKTAIIKSEPLVLMTYKRIRLVQTCMGYDSLLPLPSTESLDVDEDVASTKAWSKKQALQAIVSETRQLMVEFEEPWREVEDDVVLVDADQSVTF